MTSALGLYRRHGRKCPHRGKGQNYVKCTCPVWAYGDPEDGPIRQSMKTRDWQRATRKLEALLKAPASGPPPKSTDEAIDAFLRHCRELAPATIRKYTNVMNHLRTFCGQLGTMNELTVEGLDAFRASRRISPVTSTKELQTIRQFCGFCMERKWLEENVAKKIKPPRNVKPSPIEPYTLAEVAQMIAACDAVGRGSYERLRARAMVLLLRYTALRISDVATLQRDRIRNGQILLHTLKTGGTVYLPIVPELQRAIDALPIPRNAPPDCQGLFWNGLTSRRAVVGIAERTLVAVFKVSRVRGAKAHRFRHTLATEILTRGGTEQDAADILGISPAVVRKHYAKWNQARQQRITDLFQGVFSCTIPVHTESEAVN